jgi:hypothetical protein
MLAFLVTSLYVSMPWSESITFAHIWSVGQGCWVWWAMGT